MYLALNLGSAGYGRACRVDRLAGGSWCPSSSCVPRVRAAPGGWEGRLCT